MTGPRRVSQGKGRAAPSPVQDSPALPPNPTAPRRERREEPQDGLYTVVGPKVVGGASKGQDVVLCLTKIQAQILIDAGHVVPAQPRPSAAEVKEGN